MLYDKGISLKNSLIISLFAPLLGAVFFALGVFAAAMVTGLLLFGVIMYLFNKTNLTKLKSRNMNVKLYRI